MLPFALFDLPDQAPENFAEPLILPGILLVIGLIIYGIGYYLEVNTKKAPWKTMGAIIPMAIGAFMGIGPVKYINDPFYRSTAEGSKMLLSHWGALVLPLLGILGVLLVNLIQKKQASRY